MPAVQLATQMRKWGPKKMNPQYEAIADFMLANPEMSYQEIGKRLNYTNTWISMVVNSDSFRAYYQMRRESLNSAIRDNIAHKMLGIADKSLDLLAKGIEEQGDKLSVLDRVTVADRVLERLGYGTKPGQVANVNVQVNASQNTFIPVDAATLQEARSSLRAVEQMRLARNTTLDAVALEPPQDEGEPTAQSADVPSVDTLIVE
jgi:hypothetical protein